MMLRFVAWAHCDHPLCRNCRKFEITPREVDAQRPGEDNTIHQRFKELAEQDFTTRGWAIDGDHALCPDHNPEPKRAA